MLLQTRSGTTEAAARVILMAIWNILYPLDIDLTVVIYLKFSKKLPSVTVRGILQ